MSYRIQFHSKPYMGRAGLIPMIMMLSISWCFVLVWLGVSYMMLSQQIAWSILLFLSTFAYAGYLAYMSYKLYADSRKEFFFELTDSEAVLEVIDELRKKRSTQMVLLDDISYVEYYPFTDSELLIMHTAYTDMEVPLWPMHGSSKDVIDFLVGRGVPVMNVQFDDKLPQ